MEERKSVNKFELFSKNDQISVQVSQTQHFLHGGLNGSIEISRQDIALDLLRFKLIQLFRHFTSRFSELLSFAYATSYLFLLGNVIICLSFSSAELIMVDVQLDEIIRIIAASVAQLLHIYYLSWTCQRLLDRSGGLHEVIYNCNWYKISMRSRRLLKFMLMRTIKPCQIKAGKMHVMSMENFSSILQVSVSYFTMLTSLQ